MNCKIRNRKKARQQRVLERYFKQLESGTKRNVIKGGVQTVTPLTEEDVVRISNEIRVLSNKIL